MSPYSFFKGYLFDFDSVRFLVCKTNSCQDIGFFAPQGKPTILSMHVGRGHDSTSTLDLNIVKRFDHVCFLFPELGLEEQLYKKQHFISNMVFETWVQNNNPRSNQYAKVFILECSAKGHWNITALRSLSDGAAYVEEKNRSCPTEGLSRFWVYTQLVEIEVENSQDHPKDWVPTLAGI